MTVHMYTQKSMAIQIAIDMSYIIISERSEIKKKESCKQGLVCIVW